jgi:AraC-like DNA-binding protein
MRNLTEINPPAPGACPSSTGASGPLPTEDLSAQPLRGVPGLLSSMGADFETVARSAGLPATVLGDPGARIAFADAGRLLHACAQATECPHFGVLLGMRVGLPATGPAVELALNETSVLQSLRAIQAHLHLHDRGAALGLRLRNPLEMELSYLIYHPGSPGVRHLAEGTLAIAMSVMRALCGPGWAPNEVTFARDRPDDTSAYRECFGAALRFNAARFALVFDTGWLTRPVRGADAAQRLRLVRRVTELERSTAPSTSERTRASLMRLLIEMHPSIDRVAQLQGVSRRTLNRRLAREGTSFKALLEDARSSLAMHLLRETRMRAIDVAAALHYTTPSAFSRAFRSWNRETAARRLRSQAPSRRREGGCG